MTTVYTTESGTKYLVEDDWVTRMVSSRGSGLRRDGFAVKILMMVDRPTVGRPLVMYLDLRGDDTATMRITTPVVSIEEVG